MSNKDTNTDINDMQAPPWHETHSATPTPVPAMPKSVTDTEAMIRTFETSHEYVAPAPPLPPSTSVGIASVSNHKAVAMTSFKTSVQDDRIAGAPLTSQQPYRTAAMFESDFQQGIEQVAARTAVLGLTYAEHRLMKELHKLSKYVLDTQERRSARQFPTTAVAENNTEDHYRTALRYYTTVMYDFLSETDALFDEDGRLRQPWYRDSLRTGRIVTLAARNTIAADAFNFLHTRNNKVAPDALIYDFSVSVKE